MRSRKSISSGFDVCWVISFLTLMIIAPVFSPQVLFGSIGSFVVLTMIGATMIFSKFLKDASFVGKILYWVAINVMKPRTTYNHIIWGLFILFFGLISLVPTGPPNQSQIDYLNQVEKSPGFWTIIFIVLLFNILVGGYTAKKHRKD